jgi:glycosyltransferase involved in cell wall biosynthesis
VSPAKPDELGRTIAKVLADPIAALQMATQARAQAREQFSAERLGREIRDIYRQILGGCSS